MGKIAKNVHSKFDLDPTRNDGALGFFQTASPPNNNNNKKKKKISSVWGPVPGPKNSSGFQITLIFIMLFLSFKIYPLKFHTFLQVLSILFIYKYISLKRFPCALAIAP